MTTTQTAPDGNLATALRRLGDVTADLTDPQPQSIDGVIRFSHSRYEQLRQAVAGITRERSGGPGSLPIWPDALDLLTDIDHTVRVWYRDGRHRDDQPPAPTTTDRLDTITHRRWRPQDVRTLDDYSGQLEAWAKAVDALLIDNHTMDLLAPCPACNTRTVQRSQAGELVNRNALQVDADGCHCLECHTVWAPQYFVHLARVIGCPPPAGILE